MKLLVFLNKKKAVFRVKNTAVLLLRPICILRVSAGLLMKADVMNLVMNGVFVGLQGDVGSALKGVSQV